MKSPLIAILTCMCFSAFGQFGWTEYEYFEHLKDGQTLVVKTGNEGYDRLMEDAFKKYWKVNEFSFVNLDEAKGKAPDPGTFYLTTVAVSASYGTVNYDVFKLFYTNQLQFDKRGKVDYQHKKMNYYATAQFEKLLSNEQKFLELYTQAELIKGVQLINNHFHFVLEQKLNKHLGVKDYLKVLSEKNRHLVHQHRLLLIPETLQEELRGSDAIGKLYNHPYSIATMEDVYRSIINQTDDIYVLFYMDGNLTYKTLIQAKDSKILFGEVTTGFGQETIKPAYIKRLNSL
ncbi:MAG TPA: hypothetical protein VGD40_05350 [Chryseosolibacter sp.]